MEVPALATDVKTCDTPSGRDALLAFCSEADCDSRFYVDFDHTLFLRNSTEAFLDCARPAGVYAVVLKALGALAPWRFSDRGEFVWRDIVRMSVILMLAPWTLWVFHRRAGALMEGYLNRELDRALSGIAVDRIVIVSFGFRFVLQSLLRQTRYAGATLVAPGYFESVRMRRDGKAAWLSRRGMPPDPASDVFITDNAEDDADLLELARHRFIVRWAGDTTTGALHNAYVPFFYTARVKRTPGFLFKQVFLEEGLVILLAYGLFMGGQMFATATSMAGIVLLFLAYHLVYEIGYAENDRVGLKKESDPKLSKAFFEYQDYRLEPMAWIWAAAFTLAGVGLIGQEYRSTALNDLGLAQIGGDWPVFFAFAACWMAIIFVGRLVFAVFNRTSNLKARVFTYLPLHLVKYFGLAVLLPLHPVGAMLLSAQVIRTWALYAVRRAGGDELFILSQSVRLAFFLMLIVVVGAVDKNLHLIDAWQTWAILAFCIIRAAPEMLNKLRTR